MLQYLLSITGVKMYHVVVNMISTPDVMCIGMLGPSLDLNISYKSPRILVL